MTGTDASPSSQARPVAQVPPPVDVAAKPTPTGKSSRHQPVVTAKLTPAGTSLSPPRAAVATRHEEAATTVQHWYRRTKSRRAWHQTVYARERAAWINMTTASWLSGQRFSADKPPSIVRRALTLIAPDILFALLTRPAAVSNKLQDGFGRWRADRDNTEDLPPTLQKIRQSMRAAPSLPFIRLMGWGLSKIWRSVFTGVRVNEDSVRAVQRAFELHAASTGGMGVTPHLRTLGDGRRIPVVFLPTHKSHLDYLLMSYVCFAYNLPLPHIAAGDNLNIPIVGPLFRACGSFFIRRSFRGDETYKAELATYLQSLLVHGRCVEVFAEGGRSRSGTVMDLRLGVLAMFMECVWNRSVDDVLIVPIALDFDRVPEAGSYAKQNLGMPKTRESLSHVLSAAPKFFEAGYGGVSVRLGTPMSLHAVLTKLRVTVAPSTHASPSVHPSPGRARAGSIAHPTRPVHSDDDADEVHMHEGSPSKLRSASTTANAHPDHPSLTTPPALVAAVGRYLTGRLERTTGMTGTSLVAAALLCGWRHDPVTVPELCHRVGLLRSIVVAKAEFLAYSATLSIPTIVEAGLHLLRHLVTVERGTGRIWLPWDVPEAIGELRFYAARLTRQVVRELVSVVLKTSKNPGLSAGTIAQFFKSEVNHVGRNMNEAPALPQDMAFGMVAPFLDAAWLVACSAQILITPCGNGLDVSEFIVVCRSLGLSLLDQGRMLYAEALTTHALSAAVDAWTRAGVLRMVGPAHMVAEHGRHLPGSQVMHAVPEAAAGLSTKGNKSSGPVKVLSLPTAASTVSTLRRMASPVISCRTVPHLATRGNDPRWVSREEVVACWVLSKW